MNEFPTKSVSMWRVLLTLTLVGAANVGDLRLGMKMPIAKLEVRATKHGSVDKDKARTLLGTAAEHEASSRSVVLSSPRRGTQVAPPRGSDFSPRRGDFTPPSGQHDASHVAPPHYQDHDNNLMLQQGHGTVLAVRGTYGHGGVPQNDTQQDPSGVANVTTLRAASPHHPFRSFVDLSQPHYADPASVPITMFSPEMMAQFTTAQPPTLPPALDSYRDHQPFDTAMGSFLMNQFVEPMTVTPPPSQSALDLAYGCPALLEFPDSVTVQAPTGCDSARFGAWQNTVGDVDVMKWNEICTPNTHISAFPIVRYALPNGDIFGYSRETPFKGGKSFELLDCGLRVLFTMTEKLVRDKRGMSGEACEKYGSCDGAVYVQYNIHASNGALVASSPYLTLFQDSFKWSSPGGMEIATASRVNGWSPRDVCPAWSKSWLLRMNSGAPPPFNDVTMRWPIAEAVTMFSLRDDLRDNAGVVSVSTCSYKNSGVYLGLLIAVTAIVLFLTAVFTVFCHQRVLHMFITVEDKLFPRAVYRASKLDP